MASPSTANAVQAVAAAFSAAAAMIPAGLAPLRYEVRPAGVFRQVAVSSGPAGGQPVVLLSSGGGHVVALRQDGDAARSQLYDIGVGRVARRITAFRHGGASVPSAGTDAGGRAVVVVKPCAPSYYAESSTRRCDLVSVDVATGRKRSLAGTEDAVVGDMDHGRLVTVGPKGAVLVGGPASVPATVAQPMPLGNIVRAATRGNVTGDVGVDAIDFEHGVVAMTVFGATDAGNASILLVAKVGGVWNVPVFISTGGAAQGTRIVEGPQVTPTGARAYVDGTGDVPSYAARWSVDGPLLQKVSAGELGTSAFAGSSAFTGDTLITAPSDACDDDCQVEAAGPVRLG